MSNEPCRTIGAAGLQPGSVEQALNAAWQVVTSSVETAGPRIDAARAICQAMCDERGLAECLLLEARFDGEMDRYFEALRKANDAYGTFRQRGDIAGQVRSCRILGYLYSRHGKYDKALEHMFHALRQIKDAGYHIVEGLYPIDVFILNNIAFIYAETGRSADALNFFYQAYEIAKTIGGSMIATVLTNIAEMHLNNGDTKMALRYNKMALTEIRRQKLGFHDLQNCHNSFGLIYMKMGLYDKALESFRQSLDAAVSGESKYNQIVSRLELSRLHLKLNDHAGAIEAGAPALELAEEIQANVLLRDICLVMAQASERAGDATGALTHYKRHMEANREISTREVERRISDYTAEFRAEQAVKDAEIYRLKNIELKQKSDELEESSRSVRFISEIGRKITASLDIGDVLNTIYESMNNLVDVNIFGIGLYDAAMGVVDFRMIIENGERLPLIQVPVEGEGSTIGRCVKSMQELVIDDLEAEPGNGEFLLSTEGRAPRSIVCCPLILADNVIGVMTLQSYLPNAYSRNNVETMKALGSYIAIALNNSRISGELRQKASELELLSKTDPLTGLYNRRYIIEKIEEERTRFRRYGKIFSLIIIDIDFFKRVNDHWGHDCGDHVLMELASLFMQLLREQDCLARWGGEEFLILLPETDSDGAGVLAERLRANVQDRVFKHKGRRVTVTLTLGVSEFREGISIDDAISNADNALYAGKGRGRNCVVIQ